MKMGVRQPTAVMHTSRRAYATGGRYAITVAAIDMLSGASYRL